jgi:hypothetical protein
MAIDRRRKNVNWNVTDNAGIAWNSVRDGVLLAVLMDIRDELQRLNTLLHCPNFIEMPRTLRRIDRRLAQTRKLTGSRRRA